MNIVTSAFSSVLRFPHVIGSKVGWQTWVILLPTSPLCPRSLVSVTLMPSLLSYADPHWLGLAPMLSCVKHLLVGRTLELSRALRNLQWRILPQQIISVCLIWKNGPESVLEISRTFRRITLGWLLLNSCKFWGILQNNFWVLQQYCQFYHRYYETGKTLKYLTEKKSKLIEVFCLEFCL